MEEPKEKGIYLCTLDDGSVVESPFVTCPNLGIAYFKNVVNTGRYVASWTKIKEQNMSNTFENTDFDEQERD